MSRTCLIFTCQLSPADLHSVKEITRTFESLRDLPNNLSKYNTTRYHNRSYAITQDLREILSESATNNFRFNAYLLKMAILKIEHLLSEIQLDEDLALISNYNIMHECHNKLIEIFVGITEQL